MLFLKECQKLVSTMLHSLFEGRCNFSGFLLLVGNLLGLVFTQSRKVDMTPLHLFDVSLDVPLGIFGLLCDSLAFCGFTP